MTLSRQKNGITKVQYAIVLVVIALLVITIVSYSFFRGSSVSNGPIVIGFIAPLSGTYAPDGQQELYGAQLAVSQVNSGGGVLGRQLEILPKDEGTSASSTVTSAQILINQEGVRFMIGPFITGDLLAILPLINDHRVVTMLASSSLNSLMVPPQNQYLWRVTLPDSGFASLAIQWLTLLHARTFAFEAEDYAYAHEVASFIRNGSALGKVTEITEDYYPGTATDYSSTINKLAALEPDAVVILMTGTNAIDMQKEYATNPITRKIPVLYEDTLLFIPSEGKSVDASVPNGMNNTFIGSLETFTNRTGLVARAFENVNSLSPYEVSFFGYDSIMVLSQAIQRSGSLDTTSVENTLMKTNYTGAGGTYVFQNDHNPIVGPGYLTGTIFQAAERTNGLTYGTIWPPAFANATLVNPSVTS